MEMTPSGRRLRVKGDLGLVMVIMGALVFLLVGACGIRAHPTEEVTPDDPSENEVQQSEWASLARENVLRMRSDSIRCAAPRPRVIKVQDVHPHAYKRYVPSCVELHRCDRQAGCCDDENNVCTAIHKPKVYLHFYVVALGDDNGVASVGVNGQVERLRFSNHTKCACRKRKRQGKTPLIGQSQSEGTTGRGGATWWWLLPLLAAVAVTQ